MKSLDNLISMEFGASPTKQEISAVNFIVKKLREPVKFLCESRIKGSHTPDIRMGGKKWEIKTPTGTSSRTIENNLRLALKQSAYIIIDLRDNKLPDEKLVREVRRNFEKSRKIRRIIVITKLGEKLDFKK